MQAYPEYSNLVQMAAQRAAQKQDAVVTTFLKDNGQVDGRLTFGDLDGDARKIGAGLVAKGLAGHNLLLLFTPGLDYIRSFFGCLYAGCVPVPAYPPVGAKDLTRLQRVAQDCNAGAILSNSSLAPVIEAWVTNLGHTGMPCIATDRFLGDAPDAGFEPHQSAPDDIAFLQYTSGSTGHPKGVMVSHGNLLANFRQILDGFFTGSELVNTLEDLRIVIWLPPFHDMGLIGGVLTPIFAGAHVTLMSPLTFLKRPLLWLQTISEQQAHVSGGPNFGYQYCVRKISEEQAETLDLSSWKVAFNGAEPIQVDALDAFAERFGPRGFSRNAFLPCYGLAEASLYVTGSPCGRGAKILKAKLDQLENGRYAPAEPDTDGASLVSSGVVAVDADVKIVNLKTREQCADGDVGEIWVNSPSVAKGYWDKPQFSASVFTAHIEGDTSGTPYMRTGDLGFMQDNELYVTGRIKEVIIIAGRNLYPQDIEQTLQESNPSFRRGGGAAFAVNQDGKEQLVILQEVNKAAGDQADYKMLAATGARAITSRHGVTPTALVLIPASAIPKTSSGKIQRGDAKHLYTEGNFAPLFVWQPGTLGAQTRPTGNASDPHPAFNDADFYSSLYQELQTWVAEKLDMEPHHIDLDVTFAELGVDSVEAVELVDRLQDRIGRTIPAIELLRYPTVDALIRHYAVELEQKALVDEAAETEA